MPDSKNSNIFNLQNPDGWLCSVDHFTSSLGRLRLELKYHEDRSQHLYLRFRKVRYFTGHFNWSGANFSLASEANCISLLNRDVHEKDQMSPSLFWFANLRLFEVKGTDGKHIQIIANAGWCENMTGTVLYSVPDLG